MNMNNPHKPFLEVEEVTRQLDEIHPSGNRIINHEFIIHLHFQGKVSPLDAPALASMICSDFDNAQRNIGILLEQFDCHRIGKFDFFLVEAARLLNLVSAELLLATKEPPVPLLYQERHLEAFDSYKRKWTFQKLEL